MKDHLRKYFPDRFEDNDITSWLSKNFRHRRDPAIDKRKCEDLASNVFRKSNELKLLAGAMKKYGCNFSMYRHVSCETCSNCDGGYDPDTNQIILCQNNYLTQDKILATMMHEMIHMFDFCRAQFDFSNIDHIACSEIRAANLSYCSLEDKLNFPGPHLFSLKQAHQYCVKEVAFKSVKAYSPNTKNSDIVNIIEKVFPGCYNDLEPFGRRPLNGSQALRQSYRERYYYGYVY